MAAVALGFAGKALGGAIGGSFLGIGAASWGGAIGSLVGGLIDNMLFPVKTEGPRLNDLRVQASSYGQAIPRLYGTDNRLAGNVIWSSGLIETKKKVKQGGKGGPSVQSTEYSYRTNVAVAIGAAIPEGRLKKVWANAELIYDADGVTEWGLFSAVRFYTGATDQLPDPTVESFLGMGEAPAYRGTAYIVIADLQLADYGNRLPNLEFLIEANPREDVGTVAQDIVTASGIDPNTVSYGGLSRHLVRGFMVGTATSSDAALQPLALAFNFDLSDQGGGLRLYPRGSSPAGVITLHELGGHEPGGQARDPLQWSREVETGLPRQASVTFSDPERDFQPNSQSDIRSEGSAENNLTTEIAIVLSADEGRAVASRLLWEAWNGRQRASGAVTDRWRHILAGKVYLFETPAGLEPLRLLRRTRGVNGVIEIEVQRDNLEVYASSTAGASADVPPNEISVPGPTVLATLDTPIFLPEDDNTGFYAVLSGELPGWRGADILRSTDGGSSYNLVASSGAEAIMGNVVGTLAAGPTATWDRDSVLTVQLDADSDELESLEELDVLNGNNAAWVGSPDGQDGEILQFTDAEEISAGLWELRGLLRGRIGTEYAVGAHGSGERFVILDRGTISRLDFGAGDWNRERLYKPVSLLETESETDAQEFTNTGEGKRPLSPVHARGERDDANDLTISWVRRSRLPAPGLGNGPVPLGESTEAYEVDILSGSTVVRTLEASTPTVAYSAAQQATDGLTPGNPVSIRVYQLSDVRGRGRPLIATV